MDQNPPGGALRPTLVLAALGVVFGDIGTSPLYALRECFAPERGVETSQANVVGIVSLLVWILFLIVSVKYLAIVLRADNRGEGGILALVSLVGRSLPKESRKRAGLIAILGIVGAALLYSDGIITPAISVLSAVEGLQVFAPGLERYIIPIALVILVLLFPFQSKGTAKVGRIFGPVIVLWFLVIAALGLRGILAGPAILLALDPREALGFAFREWEVTFKVLGSIFLAMTGAEVLYADLGHFGRRPIRAAWFGLVFPALILNYLGQGAWILAHPGEISNLFYRLAPAWAKLPLVALATGATVIASQAVISGAFSLARQSVQLGYWPRIQVRHTSEENIGQVYVPFVNLFLLVGTVALVLGFKESGRLASAYGIAVSATMAMTTCLMLYVSLRIWKKGRWYILPLGLLFLAVETAFLAANLGKVASGGWIVVVMAVSIFILMKTWMDGRRLFRSKMANFRLAPETFAASIALNPPHRIPGTAVFLSGDPTGVPKALLHNLKNNRVLHARTILLTVQTLEVPSVEPAERLEFWELEAGIWKAILHFGFSETPDVPRALRHGPIPGFSPDATDTIWFLGRETITYAPVRSESGKARGLSYPRKRLFGLMFGNALDATAFYRLPINRIVELGAQTEL